MKPLAAGGFRNSFIVSVINEVGRGADVVRRFDRTLDDRKQHIRRRRPVLTEKPQEAPQECEVVRESSDNRAPPGAPEYLVVTADSVRGRRAPI
jgi:hypothetical protein